VDITVENIASGPPAFPTTYEVSAISDASIRSPNAPRTFSSPVDASYLHSEARADALDSAASKISIDTASTVLDADNQALSASHVSASPSPIFFGVSMPAHAEGRLGSPQVLIWLRSRLAPAQKYSVSTVLTVAWWQLVFMRILPLNSKSTAIDYRLSSKPATNCSKMASWWRGISSKHPSAGQINRVCGNYRLVYLHTVDISNVNGLNSRLCRHWLYRRHCIIAMFPFATDLWEILVALDYANQFIECAKACDCLVEEVVHPGSPVGQSSDFWSPFESCLRARERLIARALIAQLASGLNELAPSAAPIYRDLVRLYECYDASKTLVALLLDTDQPLYSPGWSCIIDSSQYPSPHVGTKRCE